MITNGFLFESNRSNASQLVPLYLESKPITVLCQMGNFGCGGGGWTPVMKINGRQVSFIWRNILGGVFLRVMKREQDISQDEIARIRKRKRGRNMLNRSGNTTDNLCFRYRFRDVFSRFRCCVYNGTGPLLRKHNGNMELHVSATFQKYGNM